MVSKCHLSDSCERYAARCPGVMLKDEVMRKSVDGQTVTFKETRGKIPGNDKVQRMGG